MLMMLGNIYIKIHLLNLKVEFILNELNLNNHNL